jgi:ribosomal protein S3
MNFRKSKLLALFIANNITDDKRHYNFLKKIKKIMSYYFKNDRAMNFYGIYITIHGKFQGYLRKRRFKIRFGRPGVQKLKVAVDYNLQRSFTRFGVFSIKV